MYESTVQNYFFLMVPSISAKYLFTIFHIHLQLAIYKLNFLKSTHSLVNTYSRAARFEPAIVDLDILNASELLRSEPMCSLPAWPC
jgi:hypothetical protein